MASSLLHRSSRIGARCLQAGDRRLFHLQPDVKPRVGPALQRSYMYVPADKSDKLKKMANPKPGTVIPDIMVLNCEDGVALANKDLARSNLVSLLNDASTFESMARQSQVAVRVNSAESGLAEEDIKAVLSCKRLPQMLSLPKVDSVEHLKWLADVVGKARRSDAPILVMAFIESARSLVDLVHICRFACETDGLAFRLQGLVFGSDDYCHSIGVSRTPSSKEVLYPRQRIVTVAKAFNLSAIDMVNINVKDLEPLTEDCLDGACLGFSGKQVIHPAQLAAVHSAFRPAPDRVQWARDLLAELDKTDGTGALLFRGQMIDEPTVLQARQVDAVAAAIAEKEGE